MKQHTTQIKEEKKSPERETKEKIIEEQVNLMKRLQADFENYIKRTEKEKQAIEKRTLQRICAEFLNIVDDFDAALNTLEKEQESTKGIEMIYDQITKFLERHHVKKIETTSQLADPFKHEVIKKIDSDQAENMILTEVKKGYMFYDDILRPSKVVVSSGKKGEEMSNQEETHHE